MESDLDKEEYEDKESDNEVDIRDENGLIAPQHFLKNIESISTAKFDVSPYHLLKKQSPPYFILIFIEKIFRTN